MSRQREWQKRQNKKGKCQLCAQPRSDKSNFFCAFHHEQHNTHSRNRARAKKGIPLDLPTRSYRKQEVTTPLLHDLEAAFLRVLHRLKGCPRKKRRAKS